MSTGYFSWRHQPASIKSLLFTQYTFLTFNMMILILIHPSLAGILFTVIFVPSIPLVIIIVSDTELEETTKIKREFSLKLLELQENIFSSRETSNKLYHDMKCTCYDILNDIKNFKSIINDFIKSSSDLSKEIKDMKLHHDAKFDKLEIMLKEMLIIMQELKQTMNKTPDATSNE